MKEEKLSVKEKLKRIIPNIKSGEYANIAIIFIVSIFVCLPLLNKNCNIYIDDGIQHLCRLIGTEQTLVSKQFLPMIMSNFCNNFGYSWNIFYSPITAYIPLIFRIFSFSFETCLKLFMFVVTVATGIAMYKFVIKITKNKNIAILASVLYIIAPYRITDMYIRMALAELTSFIFIPMVFSGMYSIINENKKTSLLIIGASGLILTHTVVCMYTAMLCFVYLIVFIRKLNKKSILNLLVSLLMIVLITSFYWVGLAQHYFSTSYEVFVPGRMERVDVLNFYKTSLSQLVYTDQEQKMIYEIGIVTFIGLLLTPIAIMKFEKQEREKDFTKIYGLFGILGIVLTIMTLKIFPFEKLPGTFTMIQFTFRLFEFTSFFFAIISAVNFWILIKNFNIRDVIIISLIACLLTTIYGKKISYEKKYDDVPLVTGLKYDELVMQEKIPVKKEKVFSYLLELTTAIDKYNLPIDQIYIKEDGNALLISDKITVDLYNKKDIDIKISELAGMLKKVKGKSGTIDMKYFSEDHKIAVFQPKKS